MHSKSLTPAHSEHAETQWVRDTLEPDQLSSSRMSYGRRKLGRGTIILLWALRVYVLVMLFLIGLQIWDLLHAAS